MKLQISLLLLSSLSLSNALLLPYEESDELKAESIDSTNAESFDNSESISDPEAEGIEIMATTPVPDWLQQFTGLSSWPDVNPPYIPLDFINFANIPKIPLRAPGTCPTNRLQCSFDCFKCVSYDDVYTCPRLSQTFDDGPSRFTKNLLKRLQSKSTFFTLGLNVVKNRDIYLDIKNRGHLLGSHTWSHKFLPSLTNEEIIAQFEWSIWAMNATGNHLPKWYRPPYGGIDDRVRSIARMFGMQAVVWDHDSFDWQMESKPPQRTKKQILNDISRWKEQGRGIILEHDVYRSTTDLAIEINKIIGPDQMTVAECVDGLNYVKEF
ncbi:hypothetical protein PMKS-001477 [Pichia membranifaciens]|uniref:chitin deacetylase n=1 Tax=Pichia membranifaciens TaxID=4926 RepID=A0A1Q2YEP3_9ASCO|nr:hypothetical protein PMKS-001477 [Pichia membranifaciens]